MKFNDICMLSSSRNEKLQLDSYAAVDLLFIVALIVGVCNCFMTLCPF